MSKAIIVVSLSAFALLSACGDTVGERAATGGVAGAVVGGVPGAVVGGTVGAVTADKK